VSRQPVPACEIELEFADGRYLFRLGLSQIGELQTKCGAGLGAIFARVMAGRYIIEATGASFGNPSEAAWFSQDLTETIRLGLIGGGSGEVNGSPVKVDPILARRLVETYGPPARPMSEAWTIAAAVLGACVEGYSPPGEADPPKKAGPATTTDGSTSPAH